MGLIRQGKLTADPYTDASAMEQLPAEGPLIVSLEQWQQHKPELLGRGQPLGLRLHSDQPPQLVADDLRHFAVVALEFPRFRDGRAYTHARMLRERLGFRGEIRAVGDVLQEQLNYMERCGFDSFDVVSPDPEQAWQAIAHDHSVWYQATGDGRPRALELRERRNPDSGRG